jgi:hypothetical protein
MKRLMLVVGMLSAITACSWWATNSGSVAVDTLAEIACVVNAAEAKQTVEQIGASCGIKLLSDVVAILQSTQTPVVSSQGLKDTLAAHPAMKVSVRK